MISLFGVNVHIFTQLYLDILPKEFITFIYDK